MELKPIATIKKEENHIFIKINPMYKEGLLELDKFSHAIILWIAEETNICWQSVIKKPYRYSPEYIGMFATRTPYRPNPICIDIVRIYEVDILSGIMKVDWIDAYEGSNVVDIKPYLPSNDAVKEIALPQWCLGWPLSREDSKNFDWESVFNFKEEKC